MSTVEVQPIDQPAFRRILLKISGEALMGAQNYGVDVEVARAVEELL
jgi:uridylate kinase